MCIGMVVASRILATLVDKRNKTAGKRRSQPYPQRNFLSLYVGGGVFFIEGSEGSPKIVETQGIIVAEVSFGYIGFVLLGIFWIDISAAFFILANSFILAAVLAEGLRILFIYILH